MAPYAERAEVTNERVGMMGCAPLTVCVGGKVSVCVVLRGGVWRDGSYQCPVGSICIPESDVECDGKASGGGEMVVAKVRDDMRVRALIKDNKPSADGLSVWDGRCGNVMKNDVGAQLV
jgi:hypothetical protein